MSRTNRRERKIRVVGQVRKEPDVRRIAKAIIALSLDLDETSDRFDDLIGTEQAIVTRRRATRRESSKTDDSPKPERDVRDRGRGVAS